jgi:hypothetical protein
VTRLTHALQLLVLIVLTVGCPAASPVLDSQRAGRHPPDDLRSLGCSPGPSDPTRLAELPLRGTIPFPFLGQLVIVPPFVYVALSAADYSSTEPRLLSIYRVDLKGGTPSLFATAQYNTAALAIFILYNGHRTGVNRRWRCCVRRGLQRHDNRGLVATWRCGRNGKAIGGGSRVPCGWLAKLGSR